ncbi:hypothetical protein QP162_20285 [Sphingomonas aurantiaca]|uniref:hypothetical protein n=1 Tax=Sphingomonas aurantiaca TaxID=185949 RepID=UPI002FE40F83
MTVAPVFVHPLADVAATATIGMGTRVWQYAIILAGARIGEDCNVCAHTLVEGNVVIGDRVTVKSGVFLWDGLVIEDDAFLGPNCIFTNDSHPRSRQRKPYPVTRIEKGASIGAGQSSCPV